MNPTCYTYFWTLPYDSRDVGILSWSTDGRQFQQDLPLFADAFPQPLSGPEGIVQGEIALVGFGGFDNVAASTRGSLLYAEDFAGFPVTDRNSPLSGTQEGWDLSGGYFTREGCCSAYLASYSGYSGGVARRADESWKDFRLETDVLVNTFDFGKPVGIQVGGDTFSKFTLWLDWKNQQAVLDWSFVPPADLGLEPRTQRVTAPLGVFAGQYYRLGLEVVGGPVRASVKNPMFWVGQRASGSPWASSAAIGETLALTVYEQPYTITPEGEATPFPNFPNGVSELRAWQDRRGRQQVGICMPEAGQLLLGTVPEGEAAQWPNYLTRSLGPRIGAEQGLLSYPLSFDVGPDGRIYVLDAGSSRIWVFDSSRQYLTQWGRRGSGEGAFSFGEGASILGGGLDFAGSLAVDDQGYIYVADELTKRIQKFAP